ncbi:MAG: sulfatase [Acidobacteriota bacterium]
MVRAIVVGSLLALAACSPQGSAPPGEAAAVDGPNLLLISLDALRADRLGLHGHRVEGVDGGTSPFLDQMAERGVVFRNGFANTHGTPPSHTTMFTSLYQETHGVSMPGAWQGRGATDRQIGHRVPDRLVVLPELLQQAGYATVAVTGAGFMSDDFGFDQGFDVFIDDPVNVERGVRRLVDALRDVSDTGRPVFALFHTYEIHSPYDPPRAYRERFGAEGTGFEPTSEALLEVVRGKRPPLDDAESERTRRLYDAGIRYTDDALRTLWAELETSGFLDDALVVITSDHGEELGDRGRWLHPGSLYDELIHVPLLLIGTGSQALAPAAIETQASHIDLLPTFCAAAALPVPETATGRDLVGIVQDEIERGRPARRPVVSQYADRMYSVRTREWKLIERHPPDKEVWHSLYNLVRDPGERRDVAKRRPVIAGRYLELLEAWRRAHPRGAVPEEAEPDPETVERLRSLGYL